MYSGHPKDVISVKTPVAICLMFIYLRAMYSRAGVYTVLQGVQKFSKIVINGSILNTEFAVGRLDKNKHFEKKKKRKKVCKKFRMGC